jgi:hypothetical protein
MYSANVEGQLFFLIDTPGFGDCGRLPGEIAEEILNFSEEVLAKADIHGILYLQDIMVPRTSTAMGESLAFLGALAGSMAFKNITFVTTKWDVLSDSSLARHLHRHRLLQEPQQLWGAFNIGAVDGARAFQHFGINGDGHDTQADIDRARQSVQDILRYYITASAIRLRIEDARKLFRENEEGGGLDWLDIIFGGVVGVATIAGMIQGNGVRRGYDMDTGKFFIGSNYKFNPKRKPSRP